MADIEEIRKLKARYFRLLDHQDWQGLSDVFAPDAQIDVSSSTVSGSGRGVYSSRDSFVDMVSKLRWCPPGTGTGQTSRDSFVDMVSKLLRGAVTVHHGHTEEIELTGADSASGVWAMEDRIWFPEGSPVRTLWGAGWYEEEYERVDGRWRIKRMVLRRQRLELDGNPID
ncbi:MAG: nuclear transport factor 2 family protein [Acidimicrobiaceae bacterium]|nr:nuclear transport factor 2 family protein [Acidimicrobiaceae bacterium]